MRAAVYAMISHGDQSDYSLPGQIRRCREKIEKDGVVEASGPFVDEESGFKDSKREGLSNLIKQASEGTIDLVYVYNLDRLGRHYAETPYLMYKLKELGVIVRDINREYNFDDPAEYVFVVFQCYRAHAESVRIGDRGKEGKIEKLKEGKWVGPAPFGCRTNGFCEVCVRWFSL